MASQPILTHFKTEHRTGRDKPIQFQLASLSFVELTEQTTIPSSKFLCVAIRCAWFLELPVKDISPRQLHFTQVSIGTKAVVKDYCIDTAKGVQLWVTAGF